MNWGEKIAAHQQVFAELAAQEAVIEKMAAAIVQSLQQGGRIFIAGNGGSAADAQHFAAELTGRFVAERRPLAGMALTTDTSALTAIANDYGYEEVFVRQLAGLAQAGDVFVGISTSGNSPNVLKALDWAKENGVVALGLSGRDGGKMRDLCAACLVAPSQITAHIQEAHIFAIHHLCGRIDEAFA